MADIPQKKAAVTSVNKSEVAKAIGDTNISDRILANFNELVLQGQLKFPPNYNLGNQLKLAYLSIIQNRNLAGATPVSIGQALTEMVLQGLEIDKNQCYFIKYGTEAKMFRSYFGDIAVALRTGLVKDIKAMVVYQDDEFEVGIENDEDVVVHHKTKFENRDKPIVGAYGIATLPGGNKRYSIMTKKEIDANWRKSTNPNNSTQKEFPQEMAKRTVIRRLVKMLFNSANTEDNYISSVIGSYNRTLEDEYKDEILPRGKTNVSNNIDLPDGFDDDFDDYEDAEEVEEKTPQSNANVAEEGDKDLFGQPRE